MSIRRLRRPRAALALALCALLGASGSAFLAGIHVDLTTEQLSQISRQVENTTFRFSDRALLEIGVSNYLTDVLQFFVHEKHFDNEAFAGASGLLLTSKEEVIARIAAQHPSGFAARAVLGMALHTLQDFYAHSNWPELVRLGQRQGILMDLGRSIVPDPPLATAFCPMLRHQLEGAGLTDPTSGYWPGLLGCGPIPPGKCTHGSSLGGCDGINQDSPARPDHALARSLAGTATTDYVNLVLDDPRVAGNRQALRALMATRGSIGLVLDDSSSMEPARARFAPRLAHLIRSTRGTDTEPEEYLLVRAGGGEVGPVLRTNDPEEFLAALAAPATRADATGGERTQAALLAALGAARPGQTLYLITDATARDASFSGAVAAAACARRVPITPVLVGPVAQADATGARNAAESGGQLLRLDPADVDVLADRIAPETGGDLDLVYAWEGALGPGLSQALVPVDRNVTRLSLSISAGTLDRLTLLRPSGGPVRWDDPGVTLRSWPAGALVTVEAPAAGLWRAHLSGAGPASVQARANGTVGLARLDLSEPAAETVHEALRPLPAQPAAPGALVHARLVGPQIPAGFVLLDPWGTPRAPLALSRNQRGAARADFVGTFSPEGGSVRVAAAGLDPDGNLWVRTFPTPFRIEGVEVRPESPPPTIAPGSGAQVAFRVRNHGPAGVFRVRVVDGLGLVRRVEPAELALAPGGSGLVTAEVQAPAVPPGSGEVLVVATATRASDPTIENGAALPVVIAPR